MIPESKKNYLDVQFSVSHSLSQLHWLIWNSYLRLKFDGVPKPKLYKIRTGDFKFKNFIVLSTMCAVYVNKCCPGKSLDSQELEILLRRVYILQDCKMNTFRTLCCELYCYQTVWSARFEYYFEICIKLELVTNLQPIFANEMRQQLNHKIL